MTGATVQARGKIHLKKPYAESAGGGVRSRPSFYTAIPRLGAPFADQHVEAISGYAVAARTMQEE